MRTFAEIDAGGNVLRVIVIEPEMLATGRWGDPENWVETTGKTSGIGYTFDAKLNVFVPPKPYPSFVLDKETGKWLAPKPKPTGGKVYAWNEMYNNWVVIKD